MRLIDADALKERMREGSFTRGYRFVDEAPTVKLSTFHVVDRKTGKEADCYEIALYEEWAKGLCYCDMEGFAIGEDGTLWLMDECGKMVYADGERFEVIWDDPEETTECG